MRLLKQLSLPVYLFPLLLLVPALEAVAQQRDGEQFRVEVTGTAWFIRPSGTVRARGEQVDIRSDLGIESGARFFGKLVLKPGRRHRIIVEGAPYHFSGDNVLQRDIVFGGRTYTVRDRITSSVELDYVFAGYQYDFVSNARGHFGVLGGAGYMDAFATAISTTLGLSADAAARVPFPLVGAGWRAYFLPRSTLLNVNGEIKGMSFGSYGRYLQNEINVGVSLGPYVTIQGGYWLLNADVHTKSRSDVIKPDFRGPAVSIQIRDR